MYNPALKEGLQQCHCEVQRW